MKPEIGSLTIWRGLYESPDDPGLWKAFFGRYRAWVDQQIRAWLRDSNDRADVYARFCGEIRANIKDGSKRFEPRSDSYRPVLSAIVRDLCMDLIRRQAMGIAIDPGNAPLASVDRWLEAVKGESITDTSRPGWAVSVLEVYRRRFREALIRRKNQPEYNPRSTEIFFAKYHHCLSTEELDRNYGFVDAWDDSGEYARRERVRLIKLMRFPIGSPEEIERAEMIISFLARVHGDVSESSE